MTEPGHDKKRRRRVSYDDGRDADKICPQPQAGREKELIYYIRFLKKSRKKIPDEAYAHLLALLPQLEGGNDITKAVGKAAGAMGVSKPLLWYEIGKLLKLFDLKNPSKPPENAE